MTAVSHVRPSSHIQKRRRQGVKAGWMSVGYFTLDIPWFSLRTIPQPPPFQLKNIASLITALSFHFHFNPMPNPNPKPKPNPKLISLVEM